MGSPVGFRADSPQMEKRLELVHEDLKERGFTFPDKNDLQVTERASPQLGRRDFKYTYVADPKDKIMSVSITVLRSHISSR